MLKLPNVFMAMSLYLDFIKCVVRIIQGNTSNTCISLFLCYVFIHLLIHLFISSLI